MFSPPIETIDNDLLCVFPPALDPFAVLSCTPIGAWTKPSGVLSDSACRCNLDWFCGAPEIEGDLPGPAGMDECPGRTGRVSFHRFRGELLLRSSELGEGERCGLGACETFLNVIVHSMSSPAKTVDDFHCTDTRISDMVLTPAAIHAIEKKSWGLRGSTAVLILRFDSLRTPRHDTQRL